MEGDKIKIIKKDGEVEGIEMPSDDKFISLKLDNGYNIGINRKEIKEIK